MTLDMKSGAFREDSKANKLMAELDSVFINDPVQSCQFGSVHVFLFVIDKDEVFDCQMFEPLQETVEDDGTWFLAVLILGVGSVEASKLPKDLWDRSLEHGKALGSDIGEQKQSVPKVVQFRDEGEGVGVKVMRVVDLVGDGLEFVLHDELPGGVELFLDHVLETLFDMDLVGKHLLCDARLHQQFGDLLLALHAGQVSESLLELETDEHVVKVKGDCSVFGLKVRPQFGERGE